jgi:ABC-2 type transport system permease protein
VVATLVRLKLRILRHQLSREPWRAVMFGLGAFWALTMLPGLIGALIWLSGQSTEIRHDVLVIAGALVLLGWAIVPVLVFGSDDSLEPARFATLGVAPKRLMPGLLVAGLVSVPAAFTAVLSLGLLIVWWDGGTAVRALVVGCAAVTTVTALLCSRLATTTATRLLGSRRAREATAVIGTLMIAVLVPGVFTLANLGLEGALQRVPTAADVLAWTPLGAVWSTPTFAADGDWPGAFLHLAVAVASAVIGYRLWALLVARAMVSPPGRGGEGRQHGDRMIAGLRARRRSPQVAASLAIAARCSRYWVADPRYVVALISSIVVPLVIAVMLATIGSAPKSVALSLGMLVAGTIGWGRHNDIAFDGSAFWMHLASGAPGIADRVGRAVAVLLWGVPAVVVGSVAGAAVAKRWDLVPAAIGAGLWVVCAGLAVSAISSVTLPYRVAAAGSSPFATEMGTAGASILAQLMTSLITGLLSLPVLIGYGLALWWHPSVGWAVLAVGVIGGPFVLWRGLVMGGAAYERRGALVLAKLV